MRRAALLLAGLLPALTGCVAAAIPIAVGGLITRDQIQDRAARAAPEAGKAAVVASSPSLTPLALKELPPPDAVGATTSAVVAGFRSFALAEAEKEPVVGRRPSVLLARASELRADRALCAPGPVAVFIDLDPGRDTFDPLAPGTPDRSLAAALEELRAKDVTVVWFTRLGASFEGATRQALAAAGFDPAGTDRLVMMDGIEERKQTRRDAIAKQLCPIALVGDDRADFDELYLYLKNPDAALALDAMIGRGWFLASPFEPSAIVARGQSE